ncbi:MAG: 1-acyl-sn-glycerol-3-phosphate acyltransferase [Chloroflexota bacterium]|nr:1-acyl-sn-glycerol-3-phosphate acyltransferase [Chloroflexota bacterium]
MTERTDASDASDASQHRPAPGLTLYTRLVSFLARLLVSSLGRVRVENAMDEPPQGPLIVVANHISTLDPPLVGGWLAPLLGRRPRFLAKASLFVGPIGAFLRSQGVIPVKAGGSDVEAFRAARAVLKGGGIVVIFPEGTRSVDGLLQEARPGVALLATRSGVPILPVGISNTDVLLGRGKRLPRLGTRVTMRVGTPFTLTPDASLPRRQALAEANEELMRRIAVLVDERHRGRFAGRA